MDFTFKQKFGIFSVIIIFILFVVLLVGYTTCVTTIDSHEMGYIFDRWDGSVEVIEQKGWVVRNPIRYAIHTIDLRPYQITISANARVLNAKLVRFNPDGLKEFVQWHGRGAGDNLPELLEILKCYAFAVDGGDSCPFLMVVQQIEPGQSGDTYEK